MNASILKNVIFKEKRIALIVHDLQSQVFMRVTYKEESDRIRLIVSLQDDASKNCKDLNSDNLSKLATVYETYVGNACRSINLQKFDNLFIGQRDQISQLTNVMDVVRKVKNLIDHVRYLDICTTDEQTGEIIARTMLRFTGQSLLIINQRYSQNYLSDFFLRIHCANVTLTFCIMKTKVGNIIRETCRFIAIIQGIFISTLMGYAIFNLYQSINNEVTLRFLISQIGNFVLPLIVWKMLPVSIKALLKHIWLCRQRGIWVMK